MSRRLTVLTATVLVFLGVAGLFLLAGGSWAVLELAYLLVRGDGHRPNPRYA